MSKELRNESTDSLVSRLYSVFRQGNPAIKELCDRGFEVEIKMRSEPIPHPDNKPDLWVKITKQYSHAVPEPPK